MSPATAALLPDELAWVAMALKRHIMRSAEQLGKTDVTEGELAKRLKSFGREAVLLSTLLAVKAVRVEDRVGLVLALRYERGLLQPRWAKEKEAISEINFINAFLKRLSRIDWESMGIPDTPYDPREMYGSFRITEAEACAAFFMTRIEGTCTYAESFESLAVGSTVTCMVDDEDGEPGARTISIRIARICRCESQWSEDEPGGKMFEGDIISEPSNKDSGDEAFGFLFPGGNTVFVDSNPDSDYVDRLIYAAVVMLEAENT